jgi:hypothetical protein
LKVLEKKERKEKKINVICNNLKNNNKIAWIKL